MTDREWDRRLHIRTIGREDESDPNYSPYEPTPYAVLERLAGSGLVRRRNRLLDYGCGKGRAAFFLARAVGCPVTGIDHSQKLIDIARENRRTSGLGDRVTLTCCAAERFALTDEDAFFFFNPFSEKVFEDVLRRIVRAAGEQAREMRLVLYYPSEAYMQCLAETPEARPLASIDCSDLFNGRHPRERIEAFLIKQ